MDFKFKTEPYAKQLEGFEYLKDKEFSALFADMGTGKTKIALDIAAYKYLKGEIDAVLILAPNNVHSQWLIEQVPQHLAVPYKGLIWSSQKKDGVLYNNMLEELLTPKMQKLKIFSVNIEALQTDSIISTLAIYMKHNKVFTIIDEATRIKTPTAKRSKTAHRLNKYGQRIILTGTPMTKSPFGLWSMFEFLKHNFFDCNAYIFQQRHGVMMRGINNKTGRQFTTTIDEKTWSIALNGIDKYKREKAAEKILDDPTLPEDYTYALTDDDYEMLHQAYNLSVKNVKFIEKRREFTKYKRLDELKEKIAPVTFFIKKEECLDLPPKVYEQLFVNMNKEQAQVYKNLKNTLLAEYDGKELSVTNKIALTTRLMQVCGGFFPVQEVYDFDLKDFVPFTDPAQLEVPDGKTLKVKTRGDLIGGKNAKLEALKADLEEANGPIIIWAQFVAELEYLYKELGKGYKAALYYGKTSQAERENILRDFKANKYDLFIGNPSTAAYGLNLQNSTLQYYYSNSYRVEDRLQAEDRSHRLGVKNTCVYKDVICKGTIDEKIALSIATGRDMNDFFKEPLHKIFE